MAGFGSTILDLMGQQDPRKRLLASAMGQPGGAGATPAAGAGAPGGAAAPGQPPQPTATQTAPDMLELYSALSDRSRKENNIDRGISMIAASLAQPENRAAILSSMPSGESEDPELMNTIMDINTRQQEQTAKAQSIVQAREMAAELGLDPEQAAYLAENGQLAQVISSRATAKAEGKRTQIVGDQQTGYRLVDLATGEVISEVSPGTGPGPRKTVMVQTSDGRDVMVYEDTGEMVREVGGPTPAPVPFRQLSKEEIAKRGLDPTKAYEVGPDNNVQQIGGDGTVINNNVGASMPKYDEEWIKAGDAAVQEGYVAGQGALNTISSVQQARTAFDNGIITGSVLSPTEFEGRKVLADIFGIDDSQVANTAEFNSALSNVIRDQISSLGTGNAISNADLAFMQQATGAGGTVPDEAVPRILRTIEIGSYNKVLQHNAQVDAQIRARGDTINPDIKASMEAKKLAVPSISIDSNAIRELKEAAASGDAAAAAEFDQVFGDGAAASLLMVPTW